MERISVHPGVRPNPRIGKGIQAAEHVEVPPRWMDAGELRVDRQPAPLAAVQPVPKQELDTGGTGFQKLGEAVPVAAASYSVIPSITHTVVCIEECLAPDLFSSQLKPPSARRWPRRKSTMLASCVSGAPK